MITRDGRTDIKDYIVGNYTRYQVGTGGDSTNPNASSLDSPLLTKTSTGLVVTSSDESTIEWKFTLQGSAYIGETIKEVGIFHTTTDEMLLRVNYDGIGPLTSTDEIEFVIVVEVD